MQRILAGIGMIVLIAIAFLMSKERKEINWKSVGCAFVGQIVLALILITTPAWKIVEWLANGISWLLAQAVEGINFVFGGLTTEYVFFLNALLPIVFLSSVIGLLFHFGIIQKFIACLGNIMAKALNVDTIVATNGVTNMFLGQTDSLFVTKSYLPSASDSVIFATLVGGMTSISTSVVGLYASYGASMEWIIVSMPLTVFSTFALTQIIMPTKYTPVEDLVIENDKGINFIDTMMIYATSAFKAVIGIVIALMVFLSAIAAINSLLGLMFPGITIQSILSIFFYPLSVLMGVPMNEVGIVSEILATKLVTNEAVAFALPQFAMLSMNTKAMVTVALCGFAGIGSIGILIGGYSAIAPDKVKVVAKLGVKALITATLVNLLTGAVIGLIIM